MFTCHQCSSPRTVVDWESLACNAKSADCDEDASTSQAGWTLIVTLEYSETALIRIYRRIVKTVNIITSSFTTCPFNDDRQRARHVPSRPHYSLRAHFAYTPPGVHRLALRCLLLRPHSLAGRLAEYPQVTARCDQSSALVHVETVLGRLRQ